MRGLNLINKDNLHHAHLLIKNIDGVLDYMRPFFEDNLDIKTKGNSDFVFEKFDKFLIEDARRIFDLHLGKTHKDSLQIIVVAFNFITIQAQNALLKMLEEPTARTHFFIIAPSKQIFLETILSRVYVIEIDEEGFLQKGKEFLSASIKDKMNNISKLVKDIKDEKSTKQDVLNLLSGLESAIKSEIKDSNDYLIRRKILKEIVKTRSYININGASVKILLENIALNL